MSKKVKKINPYAKKKKKDSRPLIVAVVVILCLCALVAGLILRNKNDAPAVPGTAELMTVTHRVEIDIQDYGTVKAELYGDMAPITVDNFVKLAKEGFYDGLTFHRIISGFMIQGGDPQGNGYGGSDVTIKGEFSANGVNNPLAHTRGVLSMARSAAYNSASSQFFIMHKDYPSLNGQYAAFGKVTEGIEIVDQICAKTPVIDRNGSVAKANQPVITAVRVVE
ncbi:MAG: peptidylprolyl isomerase [Clostridia bacterium]|nr:peptidylprolyl isomerase [Clostridia bacterium]